MEIEEISVEDLAPRLDAGAVLLDVREHREVAEVRVPGVVHIPLGELLARMADLPRTDEMYVICRSGNRSKTACTQLHTAGRPAVNVAGGTLAWIDSGRPTESG